MFRQVRRHENMTPRAYGWTIHHQYRTTNRSDRAFRCRSDKSIAQDLAPMRPDDKEVGRRLRSGLDDSGEGVVEQDPGGAGDTVQIFQTPGEFCQKLTGVVHLVIDEPAWPVIVDDVHDFEGGPLLAGQDHRTAQRTVRPFGKVRGQHDPLHGVPSCPRDEVNGNTCNRIAD
jgi:hypothetical protein